MTLINGSVILFTFKLCWIGRLVTSYVLLNSISPIMFTEFFGDLKLIESILNNDH
ncbi:hypothetical protein RhiirA5_363728 [Rhizophagus irregularis]|uniref:Uncharacterized protein n=2 Tax=Rhizophagus irregularis TaxID=588596 RepID=A0A2I1F369_9GLOM|nr:hypothetical protein RhiirA5_363728 [Rhizophagus irregularis]PKC56475.1 hypothetical protein RhiirA1_429080 [Rhizophagus irregularis]PKK69182.1 hypothetical protein RhiirC2_748835 [Rhizophagus irregularis]PKY28829.1 hypothetical protein RhiirB3_417414 [Rhizophagus irregularis]GBC31298.1 hypothetical protein RIR_e61338_A0A2I1F369_9GLOM [Rhizophagus irregularis DAOM 181602=DAOM 197198]